MNPTITNIKNLGDTLTFTLSGVNVSVANAIRRTIISDIPSHVFITSPYEANKANILVNTSRFNNEILKQRLSCIPIHIKVADNFPYQNYQLELNVENKGDATMYVTTNDFVVRDKQLNKILDDKSIFPANEYGQYIDFVRLRPKLSDEIPGEHIQLTCDFDVSTGKQDGMFTAVSTCAYGNTIDLKAQDSVIAKKQQEWKNEGKSIDFETKNWLLLDGQRLYKPDSFDFVIQTVGVYDNDEMFDKACQLIMERLVFDDTKMLVSPSLNTMANSYDVLLKNDDYTIGKLIECIMYFKYFDNPDTKLLSYCGFKKLHPHDADSILRVAYLVPTVDSTVKGHLTEAINEAKQLIKKIRVLMKDIK
jgi:hypothetical protein